MKHFGLSSKIGKFIFMTLFFLSIVNQVNAEEKSFIDVKEGDPYFVGIQFLHENNFINGFSDGTFRSWEKINRVEAMQILSKVYPQTEEKIALEMDETPIEFSDIKPGQWFYELVINSVKRKISKGYIDKKFHPENTVTRGEAAKFMALYEGKTIPKIIFEKPYTDVEIDSWIAPYAKLMKNLMVINESRSNGEMLIFNEVSRGEYADMVYRLIKSREGWKFGRTTYYSDILAGRGMANGDPYDPEVFTVAHKTLPFGTKLLVMSLSNGKSVEVTVNDRGPYALGIELDLSKSAFSALANPKTGIIMVAYKIIK